MITAEFDKDVTIFCEGNPIFGSKGKRLKATATIGDHALSVCK
jgi:hypothetical protein